MPQNHYVWIGPRRATNMPLETEGPQVLMTDEAIVYREGEHHLEPMRGSAYTIAVFDAKEWLSYRLGGRVPSTLGYCTAHSLGFTDVKAWMAVTGYEWEGPR